MSVLECNEECNKSIEVTCVYGDPTWAYEWACILAQEMYAERGLSVFKTPSGRENFLKGYSGEECILLTGYLDQDMELYELIHFLNGVTSKRFDNVNLGNVRTIIMTTFQNPYDWEYIERYYPEEIWSVHDEIDRYIEISDDTPGLAKITEEISMGYHAPRKKEIREKVDIFAISQKQFYDSTCGYFDDLDILKNVVGTKLELEHLHHVISGFTIFQRRKLAAMIEAQIHKWMCVQDVEEFIAEMDECFFLQYVLTERDNGYDILNNQGKTSIPEFVSLFFDFEAYGSAVTIPKPDTYPTKHITKYGYIEGIHPWHGFDKRLS